MIDMSNYNVYQNKDGRYRAYNKTTHKVTSYPRVLMEAILGRPLLSTEDVHHKDEDFTNNNPDNLEVIDHREHDRLHGQNPKNKKYTDKEMVCPVCQKTFIWTTKQQSSYHHKTRSTAAKRKFERQPPCCCKSCAGKYATMIQYDNKDLEGNLQPKTRICPICGKSFIWKTTSQWRFKHGLNEIPEPCCSLQCIHALRKLIKENNKDIA